MGISALELHPHLAAPDTPPELVSPSSSSYSSRPSPPADLQSWASTTTAPVSPPMSNYERSPAANGSSHVKAVDNHHHSRPEPLQAPLRQQLPSLSSLFGPPSSIRPLHSPISDRPAHYPATSPLDRPRVSSAHGDRPYQASYFPSAGSPSISQPRTTYDARFDQERASLHALNRSLSGSDSSRSKETDHRAHDARTDNGLGGSPLNGVISGYAEQVLVCTGRDDWASRIEEEDSGDNLAADLKELFGRGGTYSDPFHNVSVLNASFPSSTPRRRAELQTTSAYLLPSFKYVPFLPRVSFESVQALAKGYLLPEALHPVHDGLSPVHRDRLLRKEAYREMLYGVQDVQDVLVLICGHGGRDARCGITGPVLRSEFETQLDAAGVHVLQGEVEGDVEENQGRRLEEGATAHDGGDGAPQRGAAAARVGLISHIGGHKFAGNVIVYVPPGMKAQDGTEHGLAGKGIWYGRVEPRHAEGIVKETILGGRVIADMFRGGIDQQRKILRM
ncbi:hypothetical protein BN1723_001258 [Verticillium longisporum]|uniref:Altered inheritance of mitochondria protein 32 n=1 Tax=Verticillium longisporum TaxID=100787 RepID=A0A0G4NKL8_VERLO|nr:hypothetical protein BN1723_001258 [Verticillium longisporum]